MNAHLFELLSVAAVLGGFAGSLYLSGSGAAPRAIPVRVRRDRQRIG